MASQPFTRFTDRANAVAGALAFTGVRPAAAETVQAADAAVNETLEKFDKHFEPLELDAYRDAGAKWAASPTKTGLKQLETMLAAPAPRSQTTVPVHSQSGGWETRHVSTPQARRFTAMREGMVKELTKVHDKPEFATAALVDSCKTAVRAWFDALAAEAHDSFAALDDAARERAARGTYVSSILELIDPATTPEATISTYRRAVRAWAPIEHMDFTAYERCARAMAFGDVAEATANKDRDVFAVIDSESPYRGSYKALWLDADGCALDVFDMGETEAIAAGLTTISPLADPLGDDRAELERRLSVISAAAGWLDYRRRTVGDRMRGLNGHYSDHTRYGASSPAASLAELKAYSPELFTTEPSAPVADNEPAEFDVDPAEVYED
ncbi:hypothetical protein [Corynebacterium senegalense]|uniref:hypothetical protein n=1 Tax=Corynebacterium senegalense TaxID=2080750 RepID=UPI0011C07CF0|nr:hypothetical protein [Corynebacterium senegalense]